MIHAEQGRGLHEVALRLGQARFVRAAITSFASQARGGRGTGFGFNHQFRYLVPDQSIGCPGRPEAEIHVLCASYGLNLLPELRGPMQISFLDEEFKPANTQGVRERITPDLGPDARPEERAFECLDFLPVR